MIPCCNYSLDVKMFKSIDLISYPKLPIVTMILIAFHIDILSILQKIASRIGAVEPTQSRVNARNHCMLYQLDHLINF